MDPEDENNKKVQNEFAMSSVDSTYIWKLDSFLDHSKELGQSIKSVTCQGIYNRWFLQLFLNADGRNHSNISLFLHHESPAQKKNEMYPLRVSYKFSIITVDNRKVKTATASFDFRQDNSFGIFEFISRKHLLRNKTEFLPEGTLTILCEIKKGYAGEDIGILQPALDLEKIFRNQFISDVVTLKLSKKEINERKGILSKQSSASELLFDHGENKKEIQVYDFRPNIFKVLLHEIIYSPESLDALSLRELLAMTDEQRMSDLKEVCEKKLCALVSISNAADTLIAAEKYSAHKLKDRALRVIRKHLYLVVQEGGIKTIEETYPMLAFDIIASIASQSAPSEST